MADFEDFDFKTRPRDHQLRELLDYADAEARAKAWFMRTGKSKAAIDKGAYLFAKGRIDAMLIVAPNGVHANWIHREFAAHMWDSVPWDGVAWDSAKLSEKGGRALGRDRALEWAMERDAWLQGFKDQLHAHKRGDRRLMVLAVAAETMTREDVRKLVARLLKNRRTYLVVDEADDFGTPGATRTKMIRALARKAPYREIMSGTMADSSPLALWSQYEILKPGALGVLKYDDMKTKHGVYETVSARGRTFPKLVGFQRLPELREALAPWTSTVLRDDVNMSRIIAEEIHFAATPQQRKLYAELRESFLVDLAEGSISVGERAPRFMKMQQVFSGFINDELGVRHKVPGDNPRLDATAYQCFLSPGKFIVWCEFQADIDMVVKRLRKDKIRVVEYHGRVSTADKAKALHEFRERAGKIGFVGQTVAGGRGLDMSVASTVINHSHTFKARMRAQAIERASRVGGWPVRLVDIIGPGPDLHVLKTTRSRRDVADSVSGSGLRDLLQSLKVQ